jgi:arylsulfatase A-like enzyme
MPHCHEEVEILEKRLAELTPPTQKAVCAQTVTRLSTDFYTLAEAFKDNGYSTAHIGKWHLGAEPYSPLEHGFDLDIPHTPAPSPLPAGFFHPFPVWQDHGEPGDHLEDRVAEAAVSFIQEQKDQPFFLNYWAFEVHAPWQAKTNQIDKYRIKADPASPQRNPVYAGMVETLDEVVGRLVRALEQTGVLENTIIVFTSDNGPYIKASKHHMPQEFASVPVSSAHPLRDGKGTIYEGGTRIPLVVVWPGRVKAGVTTDAMQQSTDFFPTFADMLGWKLPEDVTFDGVSLKSVLENNHSVRDEVFCHYPHKTPSTSLRKGDWKLIRWYADNPDQTDRYELFNLASDEGESENVAEANRGIVDELSSRIDVLLHRTEAVLPIANPSYTPPSNDE